MHVEWYLLSGCWSCKTSGRMAPDRIDPDRNDPDPNITEASPTGAQAVDRAIALILCFLGPATELSLTELAERTGLKLSTAHRLIRAWCRGGLVQQDEMTERYRLGTTTVALGQIALAHADLAGAMDELRALSDRTGETSTLGVLDGSDVVIVLQVPGRHPLRFERPAGTRVPAHASAMGKVLLAHRRVDPNAVTPLQPFTRRTIVDPQALDVELDRVRSDGFAINDGEQFDGVVAVSAPVLDRSGRVIAAIAVQAPAARANVTRRVELRQQVQDSARHIGAHARS